MTCARRVTVNGTDWCYLPGDGWTDPACENPACNRGSGRSNGRLTGRLETSVARVVGDCRLLAGPLTPNRERGAE